MIELSDEMNSTRLNKVECKYRLNSLFYLVYEWYKLRKILSPCFDVICIVLYSLALP